MGLAFATSRVRGRAGRNPDSRQPRPEATSEQGWTDVRRFGLAAGIVFVAYSATLCVANTLSLPDAMIAGAANTVPTVLFGTAAYWILVASIARKGPAFQVAAHLILCTCFAFLSYWLLLVLLGLAGGVSATQFEVRPFVSRAMAWQTLLNVAVYGMIALWAHNRPSREDETPVAVAGRDEARETLSRYFIRSGDDAVPVEIESIVSISGADDYAEIKTAGGQHLARMTLARFEELLDPARFVRVHRSRIVNLDHVARIEPAGSGRLLIHMDDGDTISASRAGSALLRERIL